MVWVDGAGAAIGPVRTASTTARSSLASNRGGRPMVKGRSGATGVPRWPSAGRPAPGGSAGGEFGAGQEEHVLRLVEHAVCVQGLAEAEHTAAQQGPAEGELAGLLLADARIPLGHLEQRLELHLESTAVVV